jgi:hypothetical protein
VILTCGFLTKSEKYHAQIYCSLHQCTIPSNKMHRKKLTTLLFLVKFVGKLRTHLNRVEFPFEFWPKTACIALVWSSWSLSFTIPESSCRCHSADLHCTVPVTYQLIESGFVCNRFCLNKEVWVKCLVIWNATHAEDKNSRGHELWWGFCAQLEEQAKCCRLQPRWIVWTVILSFLLTMTHIPP